MNNLSCVVQAGHLAYSEDPAFLCAICGNGVVVTMRDRLLRIGGMAHVVYPKLEDESRPTHFHADCALHSLVRVFSGLGSPCGRQVEAQIFGGGNQDGFGKKGLRNVSVRSARSLSKKISRLFPKISAEAWDVRSFLIPVMVRPRRSKPPASAVWTGFRNGNTR